MIAFQPQGPLKSFAADATAPTSVQSIGIAGTRAQQYVLTNISATVDTVVGWGQTDVEAKANAAAPATVSNCYYLLRGTQIVVTASPNAYFTGIAATPATIKVQSGIGN